MAKVILKGIDWLELNIEFPNVNSREIFLNDSQKFNRINFKESISYLGKTWIKTPHKRNHLGRFELVSPEGIYLDFSSSENVGRGYLLKLYLLKPIDRSLPCLLWESPFESLSAILQKLELKYNGITHSIARIDLFCHFTGLSFKSSDSKRFFGLPRGPWEHDNAFSGFSFKHKRVKVKRVEASLYNLAQRIIDLPNSFSPSNYYAKDTPIENVWNLEFKVYRQYLIERKISTISQLAEHYHSLWPILTSEKVRMVVKSKDTNKARWKTNHHWKTIQKAFGNNFVSLKRFKLPSTRQPPEKIIKRIQTSMISLAISLDLWDLSLDERVKEIFGCFDISKFSDEEMIKYHREHFRM